MISVIIKTKNSGCVLCNTLEAIKNLGEIIIIDEHSTDDTIEIAREYKARIIYSLPFEYETAYNEAVSGAKFDWIFIIEPDEIISKKVIETIKNYLNNPKKNKNAILLEQKTFYLNKEIKSQRKKNLLRLFKKDAIKPLKTYKLKNALILKYEEANIYKKTLQTLEESKIKLKDNNKNPIQKPNLLKPVKTFLYYYFIKLGFKDKTQGLIYAYQKTQEEFIFQTMRYEKEAKDDI